jgi:hypothetical protein
MKNVLIAVLTFVGASAHANCDKAYKSEITTLQDTVRKADALILPGVAAGASVGGGLATTSAMAVRRELSDRMKTQLLFRESRLTTTSPILNNFYRTLVSDLEDDSSIRYIDAIQALRFVDDNSLACSFKNDLKTYLQIVELTKSILEMGATDRPQTTHEILFHE